MTSLKIGDVVQLNSGGQKMTVEKLNGSNVDCVWFDGTELKKDSFDISLLTLYSERTKKAWENYENWKK